MFFVDFLQNHPLMKSFLIVLTCSVFLCSCASMQYSLPPNVKYDIVNLNENLNAQAKNIELAVFFSGEENPISYQKVSFIEIYGDNDSPREQQLNHLKYLAANAGANALINVESGFKLISELGGASENYSNQTRKYPYMKALAVQVHDSLLPPKAEVIASHHIYLGKEEEQRRKRMEGLSKSRNGGVGVLAVVLPILTAVLVTRE